MSDRKRKRTQGREYAIQMMYQHVMTGDSISKIKERFWFSVEENDESIKSFSIGLAENSINKLAANDDVISKFLKAGWSIDRIGEMERSILRIALAELFDGDAPTFAIMDDYVTLTKDFANEKSASFVNGLLDNIKNQFQIER